jgi:hypothetical protein
MEKRQNSLATAAAPPLGAVMHSGLGGFCIQHVHGEMESDGPHFGAKGSAGRGGTELPWQDRLYLAFCQKFSTNRCPNLVLNS